MICHLTVPREAAGQRIDHALSGLLRGYTVWRLQRLIRAERIWHGPRVLTFDDRVQGGERLAIALTEPPDNPPDRSEGDVRYLFRDHWCAVVDKAAGTVVHPTGPHQSNTLIQQVQTGLDSLTQQPGLLRAGLVHRLDRETTGAIAFANDATSHARLQQQFERGTVRKCYLAIVSGQIRSDDGVIDQPIGRASRDSRVLMTTGPSAIAARPARTRYRVLARFANATLVRVQPLTGRNHQIRVHFAAIGHPLLGDAYYDAHGRFATPPERACPRFARHALHAERLLLRHPITGCPIDVLAPLPSDMQALLSEGCP